MKALALLFYAMGNVSFCSIARVLGVSDVAVLNWVRDEARKRPEPSTKAELVVVTLDEMWQFVKKTEKLWLWEPMTLLLGEPSPGFLVAVMTPHANISSTKLASKARPSSPMIGRLSPPHSGEPTLHRQRPDRPHRTGQQQHSSFSRAVPSPHEGGLQGRGNGGFVAEDLPPPSTTISTPSPQKPQFCSLSLEDSPLFLQGTSRTSIGFVLQVLSSPTKKSPHSKRAMVKALYGFGRTGGGAGLTGVGRRWVRKIWHGRVKAPICEDAHADGESYEKRNPCRGVIPNGLGIATFCPLRSVQLLGCHCEFPPSRTERSGLRRGSKMGDGLVWISESLPSSC